MSITRLLVLSLGFPYRSTNSLLGSITLNYLSTNCTFPSTIIRVKRVPFVRLRIYFLYRFSWLTLLAYILRLVRVIRLNLLSCDFASLLLINVSVQFAYYWLALRPRSRSEPIWFHRSELDRPGGANTMYVCAG